MGANDFYYTLYLIIHLGLAYARKSYYEYQIFYIVGERRMFYASILSKYSTLSAFDLFFRGESAEAAYLFGSINKQRQIKSQ